MRIMHIKNSYMYDKNDLNGTHRYAVYKDPFTKETRAVSLTHLYQYDPAKLKRIRRGYIKEYKLGCYKVPSGVETGYLTKDVDGNPLALDSTNSTGSYSLSAKDSKRIRDIAKKRLN